ncbi:MAG: UPF0147 family protein [Candidatus Woesearchaeota archaeon]|nr:UPF0147 family protein [Candidatus Woesearchaeota archaeon]
MYEKVAATVDYLLEDSTTPKTVQEKLGRMMEELRESGDEQTKIAKALELVEDISADVNIPNYVKTQLYGISGQLEEIKESL